MEEISPPASTKSKYASFSPTKREEDQTKEPCRQIGSRWPNGLGPTLRMKHNGKPESQTLQLLCLFCGSYRLNHSQPNDQNRFSHVEPAGFRETHEVGTVEITFLDPASQKLSNKEVFLDPDSWSRKHNEMRFLISADLVNLVSESHAARQARFRSFGML